MALHLTRLISQYGVLFVGGIIGVECICIPVPGETALLTAAVYAGRTHNLDIWSVILAGVVGAVCGNFVAFWIGRGYGYRLLWRYGSYFHLNEARLKIGQYLFLRHGEKFVIFARFLPVIRSAAGLIAGANHMRGDRFAIANVTGAVIWVGMEAGAAYYLGKELARSAVWIEVGVACCVILAFAVFALVVKRYGSKLAADAERALPGPL